MATVTTTELAAEFDTTPRTLRKFLRADARDAGKGDTLPGKGSRYAIERKAVPGLKKRFAKWVAAEAEARAARAQKAAEEAAEAVEAEGDEPEVELDAD
jgi:hypothetical protein